MLNRASKDNKETVPDDTAKSEGNQANANGASRISTIIYGGARILGFFRGGSQNTLAPQKEVETPVQSAQNEKEIVTPAQSVQNAKEVETVANSEQQNPNNIEILKKENIKEENISELTADDFELMGSRRQPPPHTEIGPVHIVYLEDVKITDKGPSKTHEIKYGTFKHRIYTTPEAETTQIEPGEAQECVIKYPDGDELMVLVEAFLDDFARKVRVYGVSPNYPIYDIDNRLVGLCSVKIPNFMTHNSKIDNVLISPLSEEQLQDPDYAWVLLDMLIAHQYGEEDDAHINNATVEGWEFDKDWYLASATENFKGSRSYVDRDLKKDFAISKIKIKKFIEEVAGWYSPAKDTKLYTDLDGAVLSLFTDNLFPKEHTALIRNRFAGKPETQKLLFHRAVDWMVDLLPRMGPTVRLYIPAHLETKEDLKKNIKGGINVLQIYDELRQRKEAQFEDTFIDWDEFYNELAESRDEIALDVLIRSMVRDWRLESEKKYAPISRHAHIELAKLGPNRIIDNLNVLIEKVMQQYCRKSASFTIVPVENGTVDAGAMDKEGPLQRISDETRTKLIARAEKIAAELIELEKKIGCLPAKVFHKRQTELLNEEAKLDHSQKTQLIKSAGANIALVTKSGQTFLNVDNIKEEIKEDYQPTQFGKKSGPNLFLATKNVSNITHEIRENYQSPNPQ